MSHYVFISAPGADPALLECWNVIAGGLATESAGGRLVRRNEQGVTVVEVDPEQSLSQIGKFLAAEPEKAQSITIVGHAHGGSLTVAGNQRIELLIFREKEKTVETEHGTVVTPATVETALSWVGRGQVRSRLAPGATIHLIGCSVARDIPGDNPPAIGEGAELLQWITHHLGRATTGSLCSILASSLAPNPGQGPGLVMRFEAGAPKPVRPPDPELTPLCPQGTTSGPSLGVTKEVAALLTNVFGPFESPLFGRPAFDFSRRLIAPIRRLKAAELPVTTVSTEVRYYRDEDRDYVGVIDDAGNHIAVELSATEAKRVIARLPPTYPAPVMRRPRRVGRQPDGRTGNAPD